MDFTPTPCSTLYRGPGREDTLASGRKFCTANLKDDCTRECPAILVDFSLPGRRVTLMLDDVARERGYSDILVVDNGPEFTGRDLENCAHQHGIRRFFIDPSKARRPSIRFAEETRPAGRGGASRCRTVSMAVGKTATMAASNPATDTCNEDGPRGACLESRGNPAAAASGRVSLIRRLGQG